MRLMPFKWTDLIFATLIALGVAACGNDQSAETEDVSAEATVSYSPQPIPSKFGFPHNRAALQEVANNRDETAAREHAWDIWRAINFPSTATHPGDGFLPIWQTWTSQTEIIAAGTLGLEAIHANRQSAITKLVPLRQLEIVGDTLPKGSLGSFVKVNPTEATFLTTPHAISQIPGQTFYYNSGTSLDALNAAWPTSTPIAERVITQFPAPSFEIKAVFLKVLATGLTPLPYWQDAQGLANPTSNTWTTCVLIDPDNPTAPLQPFSDVTDPTITGKTINPPTGLSCDPSKYLYAGLGQIYYFTRGFDKSAELKSYHVLVAMHVNTKEIFNWTWQTFFWTGGANPPQDFPGSTADQSGLELPYDNYAMCTAYWQEETDGSVKICFNPYLEPALSDGIQSNCMSCHGVARTNPLNNTAASAPSYPINYDTVIAVGNAPAGIPPGPSHDPTTFDPLYFGTGKGNNTRTDFSWLVGDLSQ